MYLSNCRLQQVNRTRILDGNGPECGENSPDFGATRAPQTLQKPHKTPAFWLFLAGCAACDPGLTTRRSWSGSPTVPRSITQNCPLRFSYGGGNSMNNG